MNLLRSAFVALLLGSTACGGRVNLGEKGAPNPDPGSDADPIEPAGPDAPVGELVAQLTPEIPVDMIAVDGSFLYVGNLFGLSRCQKANCVPTLELLPGVGTNVGYVQVHERSLGVSHSDLDQTWLARYALPLGTEERVVLRGLPSSDGRDVLWHGEFVYWGLDRDSSVYRCALPSCDRGPERLGSYRNLQALVADGELVIWSDSDSIYRSSNFGAGPVQRLLADEQLSEAPSDDETASPPSESDRVAALATEDGTLYASVDHLVGSANCDSNCTHSVVRWPANGGAREQILASQVYIERLFVFGHELVWVESNNPLNFDEAPPLWSCSIDACAATRRKLGYVVAPITVVVADQTDLYWLEAAAPGTKGLWHSQIRRASRLAPSAR